MVSPVGADQFLDKGASLNPVISIVIPVCNGSDFLREAIDSALAQSFRDLEVLVVDDGSSDGGKTDTIARSYGDRIRYFRKENGGVASALNMGIREMRGKYFSWLSHDDVYLPGKAERQVAVLADREQEAIVYSDYEIIDESSRRTGVFRAGRLSAPQFRMLLVTDIPVNGCTVLVPRHCFDRIGLFDERLKVSQDYDLWFRMSRVFPFVHVPEILVRSRVHPGQGTRSMTARCLSEGNSNFVSWIDEIAADPSLSANPDLSRFLLRAAVRLKRRGYFLSAEHALSLYRDHAGRGARLGKTKGFLSGKYFAVCERSWVTFAPRAVNALSDLENLGFRIRNRLSGRK